MRRRVTTVSGRLTWVGLAAAVGHGGVLLTLIAARLTGGVVAYHNSSWR